VGGGYWRQLEWQELATLQGFPSDYVFIGSPSRITKMIAQAVQIDTARAILTEFVRSRVADES
jgi:site-specific DNA-cytosine methylase